MDKLKPCPFCGHEAMASYNTRYDFQVYCTNDACFMSQIIMETMETEEQAIAAWNKRAPAVPDVPLDILSKKLASTCKPCALPFISCPDENHDCKICSGRKAWEKVIKKWKEEQDAAD